MMKAGRAPRWTGLRFNVFLQRSGMEKSTGFLSTGWDRLSRSVVDSVEFLNELRELRIDLVIVTAPEIGTTAHDSLLLNLLSIFAEFEREMIAKRIADARAALKRQGRREGGALPPGL